MSQKEFKVFSFDVKETKEEERDGKLYGIVKGYASTYGNVDRGGDRVIKGAFSKSLSEYRSRNRPVKMYFQHNSYDIIGGFPIDRIQEDENGLYVEGEINLEVQKGKEAYALAKQGVLSDFSIGYSIKEYDWKDGVRELIELALWEVSMVGEPMNEKANVTSVKNNSAISLLELADKDEEWDSEAAIKRVREFTNSSEKPSESYKNAFLLHNAEKSDDFSAYELPFADVIEGKLVAVPRAIFAIAEALDGQKNNSTISAEQKGNIKSAIEQYYKKLNMESPFGKAAARIKTIHDVQNLSKKEFETLLRESGLFSRRASVYLASLVNIKAANEPDAQSTPSESANDLSVLMELKQLVSNL